MERRLVWVCCAIAAVRVFVMAAAFPFFTNVDEPAHYDLIVKYADGHAPRGLEPFSQPTLEAIALFGSPEYLHTAASLPGGVVPPPLWIFPPIHETELMKQDRMAKWERRLNYESCSMPLYYAAAGAWRGLGRALGATGGFLLYWVRFLNIFLAAALVWVGYGAARLAFPDRWFPRVTVAALLAFYPQDAFYSIQSDVFSPLLFGLAFIGLVKMLQVGAPSPRLGAATGLALAGAGLVKATNWPLIAVAVAAALWKMARLARDKKLRGAAAGFAVMLGCLAVPMAAWLARNAAILGDVSGSAAKIRYLTWTSKPLRDWWPHPIFTLAGQREFWPPLLASFWRGEFTWGGGAMASPVADAFFAVTSVLLVGAAVVGLIARAKTISNRPPLWLALGCVAAGVALLAVASVVYDFGECIYPSRAHPFFTSGRLLIGAAAPFFLLYAQGLDFVLGRAGACARIAVLAGIILFITVAEAAAQSPAFGSAYNWFHLWR